MSDDADYPLLFTCPVGGEEWPFDTLKATMQSLPSRGRQTQLTITVICPAGHSFKLARAARSGAFSKDVARRIVAHAQEHYERQMEAWGLPVRRHRTGGESSTRRGRGIPRALD